MLLCNCACMDTPHWSKDKAGLARRRVANSCKYDDHVMRITSQGRAARAHCQGCLQAARCADRLQAPYRSRHAVCARTQQGTSRREAFVLAVSGTAI